MQTVRKQLEEALEFAQARYRKARRDKRFQKPDVLLNWLYDIAEEARKALDRARAEPEGEGCWCDNCPICAVSVRDCQCYREGTEVQQELAGRGTP